MVKNAYAICDRNSGERPKRLDAKPIDRPVFEENVLHAVVKEEK